MVLTKSQKRKIIEKKWKAQKKVWLKVSDANLRKPGSFSIKRIAREYNKLTKLAEQYNKLL